MRRTRSSRRQDMDGENAVTIGEAKKINATIPLPFDDDDQA